MSAMRSDDDWTREESRFVDGELDRETAESLERDLEQDPARAARVDRWQEAMDLWRGDVRHRASHLEPAVLTDRILRQTGQGVRADGEALEAAAMLRYAAAAVLLIGLGLGGSLWLGARAGPVRGGVPAALRAVEDGRLAVEGDRAWQDFDVAAARPAREER